ncbi:hypothetical protein BDV96DRAFT_4596 [Lophiotrema nucula]|uniref:Uncharacterized protein n=1 Tax=Lophiotrema nucula TaxID=690887 RepID=A0A6A5ZTW8_9PLEO|nr:hypothetical protein BDV96DRAFT_4596 [Lophiotrema nucula]
MAAPAPSPSEFLTFYRTVVVRSTLRRSLLQSRQPTLRPVQAFNNSQRQFSISSATRKELSTDDSVKTDQYTGDKGSKHATNKEAEGDHHDVQSSAIKEAKHSSNETGTGGNATEASDSAGGASKAKKEFPEAPDMIGMQDERGGRGG